MLFWTQDERSRERVHASTRLVSYPWISVPSSVASALSAVSSGRRAIILPLRLPMHCSHLTCLHGLELSWKAFCVHTSSVPMDTHLLASPKLSLHVLPEFGDLCALSLLFVFVPLLTEPC